MGVNLMKYRITTTNKTTFIDSIYNIIEPLQTQEDSTLRLVISSAISKHVAYGLTFIGDYETEEDCISIINTLVLCYAQTYRDMFWHRYTNAVMQIEGRYKESVSGSDGYTKSGTNNIAHDMGTKQQTKAITHDGDKIITEREYDNDILESKITHTNDKEETERTFTDYTIESEISHSNDKETNQRVYNTDKIVDTDSFNGYKQTDTISHSNDYLEQTEKTFINRQHTTEKDYPNYKKTTDISNTSFTIGEQSPIYTNHPEEAIGTPSVKNKGSADSKTEEYYAGKEREIDSETGTEYEKKTIDGNVIDQRITEGAKSTEHTHSGGYTDTNEKVGTQTTTDTYDGSYKDSKTKTGTQTTTDTHTGGYTDTQESVGTKIETISELGTSYDNTSYSENNSGTNTHTKTVDDPRYMEERENYLLNSLSLIEIVNMIMYKVYDETTKFY